MGKRLIRITSATAFGALAPGSEIQCILHSGAALFGNFRQLQAENFFLKDKGGKIHCIPTTDIREVIFDKVAPY